MVLEVLTIEKLYANQKKCTYAQSQVEYFRHLVSAQGVAANPNK